MPEIQDPHCRSYEEDDQIQRSTKKIKDNTSSVMDVELPSKAVSGVPHQEALPGGSYKDKVMEIDSSFELHPEEIVRMVTEELFPDMDNARNNENFRKVFNPNPNVKVGLEEYERWCNPWKYSLIVRLMGKRVGFRFMSSKLKFLWAKKGDVRIMDVSDEFFLVRFSNEESKEPQSNSQLNISPEGTIVQDPMISENMEYNVVSNPGSEQVASINKEEEPIFGPWMLAKKTIRKKPKATPQKSDPSPLNKSENTPFMKETSASRFDALQNLSEDYNESSIDKGKTNPISNNQKPLKASPVKGKPSSSKLINSQPNSQKRSNIPQKNHQKKEIPPPRETSAQQQVEEKDQILDEQKQKEKKDWEREILAMMSRFNNKRWEAYSTGDPVAEPSKLPPPG
ncbi:hypothetical protein SESBI_41602 [Sesbania bispinosa]|nr:hypothetical protein SESBI_41602 [Sesbania bispinosa]